MTKHPRKSKYFPGCDIIIILLHPGQYEYCPTEQAKYRYYSSAKAFVSMASRATKVSYSKEKWSGENNT